MAASANVSMTKAAKIRRIADRLERAFGRPAPRSRPLPPTDILVATILSQNTTDANSSRAYQTLRERYPRWDAVAVAPQRAIVSAIRVGGMARQKSRRIKAILRALQRDFGTVDLAFLKTWDDDKIIGMLSSLNGVGPKTAACVMLFSLGRNSFPVDTHIHRICNRIGLTNKSRTPEITFETMRSIIPPGKAYSLHLNFIQLGRTTCRSHRPRCGACPVRRECEFGKDAVPGAADTAGAGRGKPAVQLLHSLRP